MTVYATTADYVTYSGAAAAPDNIASLLRSASRLVRRATVTAVYLTDTDEAPTDAKVIEAFMEATCEQASAWVAAGVDPTAAGLLATPVLAGKSLDGASITYAANLSTSLAARQEMAACLCDQALLILQDAHLAPTRVWTYG